MTTLRSLWGLAGVAFDAGEALVVAGAHLLAAGILNVLPSILNCETGLTRQWRRRG